METVLQFTKTIEETLTLQLKHIVETMKQTHLEEAYKGVEEMYDIKPLEGVKYDRCVMIPGIQCAFYCAPVKLPADEYVICNKIQDCTINNKTCWHCLAITNYGRILHTLPIGQSEFGGYTYFHPISDTTVGNSTHGQPAYIHIPITVCEPLPYKLPKILFMMAGLLNIQPGPSDPNVFKTDESKKVHSYTSTIQEYCKEYYMLIGKWQPFINKHIEVDFDTLRQQTETQQRDIKLLESQVENLISVNNTLEQELQAVKEMYSILKDEQKDYTELLEWKKILITHLDDNLDYGCPRKKDGTYLTPNEISKVLQNYSTIPNHEWVEACNALDQVEEFKQYQEMQKKFGQFGTTIQNTAIAVKKTKKSNKK